MAKKVVKKKAVKKVAKKKVVKKTAKPAKKIKVETKGVSVSKFTFEPIPHPKFSELVVFTKAPKWAREVVGKRYLNKDFAIKLINNMTAENHIKNLVVGGEKAVTKEIKQLVGDELPQTDFDASNVNDYDAE